MRKMLVAPSLALMTLALAGCEQKAETPAAPASVAASAAASAGPPVSAADAAKIAYERHENFEKIGKSMKAIGDQLKSGSPDAAKIADAATTINGFAPQVKTWFPAGSGPDVVAKSDALPAIWEKPAEFAAAAAKFEAEAAKFETIAKSGDMAAVGGGMKALGGACKGCHDQFKKKDES